MILRVGVGALLPAEGSDDVDEPPVVLDTGMSQGSVNLSSEEWDCDINGVVLKKSNGQVLGFKVKRLSGNVEKDILALLDGGNAGLQLWEGLSAGEVEGVVLLTAEGDVHGGIFKNPCVDLFSIRKSKRGFTFLSLKNRSYFNLGLKIIFQAFNFSNFLCVDSIQTAHTQQHENS